MKISKSAFLFWKCLGVSKKEQRDKIFDFVSFVFLVLYPLWEKKNIQNFHSLYLKPENGMYFNKDAFSLELKQIRNLGWGIWKLGFKPRLCNSTSKLRGCIERQKSTVIIVMPTNGKIFQVNKKLLTGRFIYINFRLGFDLEVLSGTVITTAIKNDNRFIFQSLQVCMKLIYNLKLGNEKSSSQKRITAKIVKLHESNQYGYARLRPISTGCFKQEPELQNLKGLIILLETINLEDMYFDGNKTNNVTWSVLKSTFQLSENTIRVKEQGPWFIF